MQRNFWASVAAFIRQYRMRKSWRRVVSALTCVVVFCTTYALILPAITMEGVYSCGLQEHVHTEECRSQTVYTELSCSGAHSHSDACYDQDGTLTCGLADFVIHSHNEFCYAEDGTLRCTLIQVTEHSGDEGVYYVLEGSEAPNTTAHIHSDSCYVTLRGQQLCTLTEGEAHIHDADCYDTARISCTLEEKEGHIHTEDCYTQIQSCEDEAHAHDDTCYYRELTCGQEEDGHTHTDACKQPALTCTLSTEPHVHDDSCYELLTETVCGKLSLTKHDHSASCVHTEIQEDLLCGKEEHLHTLICYSDPNADLETAENWEAALKDLELDGTAAENLLSVARTQLGYTESKLNYTVLEDGITQKGYTRYGAWSGTPYADWNELFLEFCLHYAGIEEETFPRAQEDKTWIETLKEKRLFYVQGTPEAGDLLFLEIEEIPYTAIVTTVNEEGYITAILGDYKNAVGYETFAPSDEAILGYTELPELNAEEGAVNDEPLHADIDLGAVSVQEITAENVEQMAVVPARMMTFAMSRATYPDLEKDNFIESLLAFYKQPGDSKWTQIQGNVVVEDGTEIRFELAYQIPKGNLSALNNIVTYQLPLDKVSLSSTGNVYDGSTVVGTYEIDENGLMTITYYPEFAEKNQTKEITGTITFGALVDDFHKDEDGNIIIDTTGGEDYTITIKDDKVTVENLIVEKTMTVEDKENGILKNVITITSPKGTGNVALDLSDWMSNNTYFYDDTHPAITITGLDSNETYTLNMSSNNGSFTMQLPAMVENEVYTITYYTKVTNASQGSTKASNSVSTNAKDDDTVYQGSDYAEVEIRFDEDPLEKSHTADSEGNVTWTITVDADKANGLKDWTLSDSMSAKLDTVTMTYTDTNGQTVSQQIKLPYTFNETYQGTVTFTYTTKVEYELGQNGVSNRVSLTPPDGQFKPPYYEDEHYTYPDGTYNPIDKEFVATDKDYTYLEWSLALGPNPVVQTAPWTIRDMLSDNQYFTLAQEQDIAVKIQTMLTQLYGSLPVYELKFYDDYTASDGTTYHSSFLLTVESDLPVIPQGTTYSITYRSTPDLGDGDQQLNFRNLVRFYDKTSDNDSLTYDPMLSKRDGNWSSAASVLDNGNGNVESLTWYVEMKITEEMKAQDKDIIIMEDVPDTLDLSYMKLNWNVNVDVEALKNGQTQYLPLYGHGDFEITRIVEEDGNVVIKIVVPNTILKYNSNIFIDMQFALPDDYVASQYPNDEFHFMHDSFTNRVEVSYEGEEPFAETEQTQTVIDPSMTEGEDEETVENILKYIGKPGTNELPYTIQINHEAADLQSDSDWLVVEDELTYQNPGNITAELLPESVKITIYNADGSILVKDGVTYDKVLLQPYTGQDIEDDIENNRIPFPGTYVPSSSEHGVNPVKKGINFYIPDGCFVKLDYTYKFAGSGKVTMNNVAKVMAFESSYESDETHDIEIKDAEVTATVQILDIQKVDANNTAKKLAGAVYELYEYTNIGTEENPNYEWHYIDILTSDRNGSLKLGTEDGEDVNTVIKSDTAYYLVEIKAPSGYVLDETRHYFVLEDGSVGTNAVVPDDFPEGAYYKSGQKLTITNSYNNRSIAVEKKWLDADGNALTNVETAIQVQLNQIFTYDNPDLEYVVGEDVTIMMAVGEHSYSDEDYPMRDIEDTLKEDVKTGDVITITYKNMAVSPDSNAELLPGLMEFRNDANYHIPYTAVSNGDGTWDYVFQLKVRRDAWLRGWTYTKDTAVEISRKPYTEVVSDQGVMVIGTVTLDSSNAWSSRWTGLPSYRLDAATGQILGYYRYEFEEIQAPDGYVTDITVDGNETTITNKLPGEIDLTVKKQWDEAITDPPESIPFTLYQVVHEEKPISETAEVTIQVGYDPPPPIAYMNQTLIVPIGTTIGIQINGAGYSFANLTDVETNVVESLSTSAVTNGQYVSVEVTKDSLIRVWTDQNLSEDAVSFTLSIPPIDAENTIPYDITTDGSNPSGTYNLTAADSWQMMFQNLPSEAMMDVTNEAGEVIGRKHVYYTYYVAEQMTGDYVATYDVDGNIFNISPTFGEDGTVTISNTLYEGEKTDIEIQKQWQTSTGSYMSAPEGITQIQFYLLRDDVLQDADPTDELSVTPYTVKNTDNWKLKIEGLPKTDANGREYRYTLKEIPVDGYESYVNGYTITNREIPKTSIKVEKQWDEGMTPEEIGVTLYRFSHSSNPGQIVGGTQSGTTGGTTGSSGITLLQGPKSVQDNNDSWWFCIMEGDSLNTFKQATDGYFTVHYTSISDIEMIMQVDGTGNWNSYSVAPSSTIDSGSEKISTFTYAKCMEAYGSNAINNLHKVFVAIKEGGTVINKVTWTSAASSGGTSTPTTPTTYPVTDLTNALGRDSQKLNTGNNWQYTWSDLPLYEVDANGNKVYYTYYVKETSGNYVTTYSVEGGITTGTIVIYNALPDEPVYELPNTGGPGTMMYTLGGLGLCGLAVLGYKPRKRRKGEETS